MGILVLGGTQFVGKAIVEDLLANGEKVSIFHRGKTGPGLFEGQIEQLIGDRESDVSALEGRTFDAVVDVSAYRPRVIRNVANALKGNVGQVSFVSTISVYAPSPTPWKEDSEILEMPEGQDENADITGETYGALKVLCERELEREFGDRVTYHRIGLQVGPYDHTDRFGDWIERIGHRQRVIVPQDSNIDWQLADVRDTAAFITHCVQKEKFGVFNVNGAVHPMTEVLEMIRSEVNANCEFVPMSDEQLETNEIAFWKEMTLWLPKANRDMNFLQCSVDKALATGHSIRPMSQTIKDSWSYLQTLGFHRERKSGSGLPASKEDKILG